jgi:hypothetical protein
MDNEKYSFLGFNFFSNYNDTKKANLNKKCNKYSYIVNITLLITVYVEISKSLGDFSI